MECEFICGQGRATVFLGLWIKHGKRVRISLVEAAEGEHLATLKLGHI
jgi:hypothetical protein